MTLKLLLLILALTANLIAQQVHCKEDEGSGDAETESRITEEVRSTLLQDEITTLTELYPQTVTPQTFPLLEEKVAESLPQVVSPKTSTTQSKVNSTQNHNVTQKQNLTRTTDSPSQPRLHLGVKYNSTTAAPHTTPGQEEGEESEENDDNHIFIIIVVALVLTLVLTAMVVVAGVLINRKRRREKEAALKEDPYLDAEGGEKVPMPMFEDDVPSVMELEMEDLEKWMIKGDGGISMDSKQKQQFS